MRLALLAELVLGGLALTLAALRWLRVAQREHYLAGSTPRFGWRWWRAGPANAALAPIALIALAVSFLVPEVGFAVIAVVALGPGGLGLRGRTSTLVWTSRLRRLAGALGAVGGAIVAIAGGLSGLRGAVLAMLVVATGVPLLLDLALRLLSPIEEHFAQRFVHTAAAVFERVRPRVVAITGSYGKTSTKGYVNHLLAGRFTVLASPRSYNNRAGLARTVNELLRPGTDILIAEMGTYGPGEIAAMCSWLPPEIAVITAIGPVHLERFRSLEVTLASKAEITVGARVAVLNVDDERLAGLAVEIAARGQQVLRCSGCAPEGSDVAVVAREGGWELFVEERSVGSVEVAAAAQVAATNVACAVGVALSLGVDAEDVLARLGSLPLAEHRLDALEGTSGAIILDDTFNSNPAGAELALSLFAARRVPGHRAFVVTPGMVELGPLQTEANIAFAARAATLATDLVVVNRTNRAALLRGAALASARGTAATVRTFASRSAAVEAIRPELGPGDVVLYENDLPDHYP